jgi:hypothetical protein
MIFQASPASCVRGRVAERIERQCQEEIKRDYKAEGQDQGKAWEEAEVEEVVVGRVPAETAFAQTAERELRTKPEFLVSSRNALNAQRLWRGSSPDLSCVSIFDSRMREKGHQIDVASQYVPT